MRVVVCVKQVPDPEHLSRIKLDKGTGTLQRAGIPVVLNPVDANALGEAQRFKGQFGGEVVAVTMGPPKAKEVIQDAYARGADRGIHLNDPAFAGSDTLATAVTLAAGIRKLEGFDLVLFGSHSIDSGTSQVPVQTAEELEVPHASFVDEIEILDEKRIRVRQVLEGGHLEIELDLPAVVSVTKDVNVPRKPTVMGIMTATRKEITTWTASDLEVDPALLGKTGSPTKMFDVADYSIGRTCQKLDCPPSDAARQAVEMLRKNGVV